MASVGLDSFLGEKEKRLVDLDWLNIDEGEYENLPFDPTPHYIAEPKLIQEWSHEEDSSNLNLIPNSEFNFNYNTPSRMSKDIKNDVDKLIKNTAKEMMSGKTGSELIRVIKEKSNTLIIKSAQKHLIKLAKEQGLLGGVYIDPTIFNNCSDGSKFVAKKAKTAKYIKAMSACASCIHNSCSRCSIYKKRIASEIVYDQELFNFYSKHISSLLGKTIEIQSKNDLQKAFTATTEENIKIAEYKPTIYKSKLDENTLENKKEKFENQIESLKEELNKVFSKKIAIDLSSLMFQNYDAKIIKNYVAEKYSSEELNNNKAVFSYILSKQGSLGKVFADVDLFPQEINLSTFLDKIPNIKFIIVKPESSTRSNPEFGIFKNKCRMLNKKIIPSISEIPDTAFQEEFDGYPKEITSRLSSIFKKNAMKGLRLAFLQFELTKRKSTAPVITENFDLQAKLDPTCYEPNMTKTISLTPNKVVHALVKGYSLSSIIKTGRKLGIDDKSIKVTLKKAFKNLKSVHKRQLDIPVSLPKNVEIIASQQDLSFELNKPIQKHNAHEIIFNSSEAPIDTLVKDLELKDSTLNLDDINNKSSDLEITGMSEFTIE